MSMNQMQPVWMTVSGADVDGFSMGATFTTDAVKCSWEDNVGVQVVWTGTPTGTITIEKSMDPTNLGWEVHTFSPAPTQPAGSASRSWFEINQTPASYVRMVYTRGSGTGTIKAKIALKSV